jgi:hypothetical protein
MNRGQKPSNPNIYTPSSEPFRTYRSNFTLTIEKWVANCVKAKRYKDWFLVGARNVKNKSKKKDKPMAGIAYCEWNIRVVTDLTRFLKAKSTPGGVIVPGLRHKGAHSLSFSAASRFRCRA